MKHFKHSIKIVLKSISLTCLIIIILWLALLSKIADSNFWFYSNLVFGTTAIYYLCLNFFENKK